MRTRRDLLAIGGLALAGCFRAGSVRASGPVIINLRSDRDGSHAWFDPIGLLVSSGSTIRWINRENVHTVTAYHPQNDNHALRIPRDAAPFDSGYLVNPGDTFETTLTVPGVYDYYCAPHEAAGMVGRIIVDRPQAGAPSSGSPASAQWEELPDAARAAFPAIETIMKNGIVHKTLP